MLLRPVTRSIAARCRLVKTSPTTTKSRCLHSYKKSPEPVVHFSTAIRVPDHAEAVERIRVSNESQRIMAVSNAALDSKSTGISTPSQGEIIQNLTQRIEPYAWKTRIQVAPNGERAFFLDSIPTVDLEVYRECNKQTAKWIREILSLEDAKNSVVFYVGFEAFFDLHFEAVSQLMLKNNVPIVFSHLVKSSREYIQERARYDAMETKKVDWKNRVVVHLGASHAMDRLLFQEDADGHLQAAWTDGRLIILSPELTVADNLVYRSGLSRVLQEVAQPDSTQSAKNNSIASTRHRVRRVKKCDYNQLDKDIMNAKQRVDEAQTMEEAFAEVYRLVIKYIERGELDSPCYFDSGWEAFHLYKSLAQTLAKDDMRIPWTRLGLINSRNAAIGDSLHTFYATAPQAFPLVVCGDTAALLAGGISMLNIHAHNRFGVVIIPNNRGMAIEDVISKRSVDGHQYQYEYVKLDRKRDVFTLAQLKDVIKQDVLSSLRDHLWGVSANRAEALVLNIDVQSLRRENASKAPTDAVLMGRSFLSDDFGQRFAELEAPRKRLEAIVDVLHSELNGASDSRGSLPVKIQGCSAIEFMEVFSQLSITLRDKLKFLPTPTDLLATRTLLPSLIESPKRTVSVPDATSNFVNSNNTFSVFVSNAAFGLDGLNNLISTHLEYGTGTLVHLAYDAADVVTHYSLVGQVHRNFGIRPSTILPSLYRNHQAYEGQVMIVKNTADEDAAASILKGLRDPEVKVILVDMGAPNLTASLK